ncbi:DnaJ-domain-containing protein [Conidiobolus coronatus NRRL 28638]|uniref:DnaJ-domain-containing protein n=1 Tax=Conidiobolus coronatus (strain ATCC 28846 / CBS 209.66 / NRRL 28638) TaxID=796925 RepID=A0A137NXU1_CONC2|nr:DnaJ-domain-containing protein [Conidiobolus coronatus NRRL 28638]|eukprot:KXN67498.1 DnaJ-domain-containing protein [Conidiobolus coronatus NRRL 28638]
MEEFHNQSKQRDYYSLLNLDKNATQEQVKDSYKKLSRLLHPDKHVDPAKKEMASQSFQLIYRAYEVLSDPNLRSVYDKYGEEGLKMKWSVGPLLKTPQQLAEEYERMARREKEEKLENLIKTKSDLTVQFNAVPLLAPATARVYALPVLDQYRLRWNQCRAQQFLAKHSYTAQLGLRTQMTLEANLVTHMGRGGGNLNCTINHSLTPKLNMQVTSSLFSPRVVTVKANYAPNSTSFINTKAVTSLSFRQPPSMTLTLGRQIFENYTGFINFKTGDYSLFGWGEGMKLKNNSFVSMGFARQHENGFTQNEIQLGAASSHLQSVYHYNLSPHTKLLLSGTLSNTVGLYASVGLEQPLVSKTKLGTFLDIGFPTGVSVRLNFERLGQNFSLPIQLTQGFKVTPFVLGITIPLALGFTLQNYALIPYKKYRMTQKLKDLRELNAVYLEERRNEALAVVTLIKDAAFKKEREEIEINGLVIVQAYYGRVDTLTEGISDGIIDVTIPLQYLVQNSQLKLNAKTSKSHLMGFYDPLLGEKKFLKIIYKFKGQLHTVLAKDLDPVALPLRSHLNN